MVTQLPDGSVEFTFFRSQAKEVALTGDFNAWQTCFLMSRGNDGWWRCQLMLAPGVYQFRYYSDGAWFNDYAAFGLEHGPYGLNSVVKITPVPAEERAAT